MLPIVFVYKVAREITHELLRVALEIADCTYFVHCPPHYEAKRIRALFLLNKDKNESKTKTKMVKTNTDRLLQNYCTRTNAI
jgi:hypothetical protein